MGEKVIEIVLKWLFLLKLHIRDMNYSWYWLKCVLCIGWLTSVPESC